jgi:large subunit ribosomal protein L9
MKVLLCEDIDKLGWLGDIVEVKTGYARNYLIPQGLAKVANEAGIRAIAEEKARRAEQRKLEGKRLEEAVKAIEGAEAVIAARANELGHLFGSVNEQQIAANLRAQGFEVRDEIVQLPEHIKEIGTHSVTLKFRDDMTATINVVVVPEQQEESSAEPQAETEASE